MIVINQSLKFHQFFNLMLKSKSHFDSTFTKNCLTLRNSSSFHYSNQFWFKQNEIFFERNKKISTFSQTHSSFKSKSKSFLKLILLVFFGSFVFEFTYSKFLNSCLNITSLSALVDQQLDKNIKKQTKKKKTETFKDSIFTEYENRIRAFSNPEKIFSYFATIKVIHESNGYEILMTPDDFVRAVTPDMQQPENLRMNQFKIVQYSEDFSFSGFHEESETIEKLEKSVKSNGIFKRLTQFGLINYVDFLFLLTLLSVSRRHFEIGFRMFDLNADGTVDYQEFEKVQNAILFQTSFGKKIGSSIRANYIGQSSALSKYFFGQNLKEKLTIDKFLNFQRELQIELLTSEFERKKPDARGRISEFHFCELLLIYSHFSRKIRQDMLKNVKAKYPRNRLSEDDRGISFEEFLEFHNFLQNINDIDLGLSFFNLAGAAIDEATLKHAAKTIANANLSDHLIEVVFTLFDKNGDGRLSSREFISVMKERLRRGLGKTKDTKSFFEIFNFFW